MALEVPGSLNKCPNCKSEYYNTYANGNHRESYCQNCGLEERIESKDWENIRIVDVARPKPKKKRYNDY